MATLLDIVLPTETVEVNGQHITLYGISFNDVTGLILKHRDQMARLYQMAISGKKNISFIDLDAMALDLIREFPSLVSDVIAYAAKAPEAANVAAALPFPVQCEALEKILKLTFIGDQAIKKFLEAVTNMAAGFNKTTEVLQT